MIGASNLLCPGPDPHRALCLVDRLGLYNTIFTNPQKPECEMADTDTWKRSYDGASELMGSGLSSLSENSTPQAILKSVLVSGSEEVYLTWFLAALVPWARFKVALPSPTGNKSPLAAAATVAREGLKADNKTLRIVQGAVENASEISALKNAVVQGQANGAKTDMPPARDVLGMAIRRWGQHWRLHTMLAFLLEIGNVQDTEAGMSAHLSLRRGPTDFIDRQRVFEEFAMFLSRLKDLQLLDVYSLKPIVDGKQISQALSAKTGPWLKMALDMVVEWQLRHPDRTDSKDAIADVLRRKGELDIR